MFLSCLRHFDLETYPHWRHPGAFKLFTLNILQPFPSVSVVDFVLVNVNWVMVRCKNENVSFLFILKKYCVSEGKR